MAKYKTFEAVRSFIDKRKAEAAESSKAFNVKITQLEQDKTAAEKRITDAVDDAAFLKARNDLRDIEALLERNRKRLKAASGGKLINDAELQDASEAVLAIYNEQREGLNKELVKQLREAMQTVDKINEIKNSGNEILTALYLELYRGDTSSGMATYRGTRCGVENMRDPEIQIGVALKRYFGEPL